MECPQGKKRPGGRQGAASVELAFILPFLCFLFVIAVDYARIFYFAVTVENCARNGAYYASDYPNNNYLYNDIYGYKNVDEAILSDASNLYDTNNPVNKPTYTVAYGSSPDGPYNQNVAPASGGYCQVTVNWTFHTVTTYPGVPNQVNISRTVSMKMAPAMPTFP